MPGKDVFAVVLAAGGAARYGSQKLLECYHGAALVTRAVRTAESVCGARSVLVTGSDWRSVCAACAPLEGFLVRNEQWRSGLGGSIAAGARAVETAAGALLLMLADQPLVTAEHLRALVTRWSDARDGIVATRFAGIAGPPVLFPAAYLRELTALTGDQGARAVLARAGGRVTSVEFEPAAVDVDRPADLAKLG